MMLILPPDYISGTGAYTTCAELFRIFLKKERRPVMVRINSRLRETILSRVWIIIINDYFVFYLYDIDYIDNGFILNKFKLPKDFNITGFDFTDLFQFDLMKYG